MNVSPRRDYRHPAREEHWDDGGSRSSSSAYERGRMSPYREDARAPHPQSNGFSSDAGSMGSAGGPRRGDADPSYMLEHLATFRVSKDASLVTPADGMRRLLKMEKTTGIWTQRMMLKLEPRWVHILSHENGEIVEKFPMELIREPTAFTSDDPKELYNNIFIFVVIEDPKRKYNNTTEMHIFQCLRINAKDVVEDMKLFMSGRGMRWVRGERIPPPPQEPAPEPPGLNGYRDITEGEALAARSEPSSLSQGDEVSSYMSEKFERNVAILNACFDDIERFIARLQHTASATKELEHRLKLRKAKKKGIGDGLLSMRAKPPPERDFIDIFQKFKLSFNLLAKLRNMIHDPNAPELVHFIFTPLGLIAETSRDSNYGANLPAKVVSPLLSSEAIELLTNCLTSRETELWHGLGEPWLIPKEAWKYPVPPYQPTFSSGWSPELPEDIRSDVSESRVKHREAELRRSARHEDFSDVYDSDRRENSPPLRYSHRVDRPGSMTPPSEYPPHLEEMPFEKKQKQWLYELKARNAKIIQVTHPRTANNDKELSVERGEYLEVVDDSRKWWKVINIDGQMAHVPHTIVTPYSEQGTGLDPRGQSSSDYSRKEKQGKKGMNTSSSSSLIAPPPPPPPPLPAVSDSTTDGVSAPQENGKGSALSDDEHEEPRRYRRKEGPVSSVPPAGLEEAARGITERDMEDVRNANQAYGTTKSQADIMNEELKVVLQTFRRRRPHLEINKTPDVYISQNSDAKEIQQWLQLKGFDERIRQQFEGVDGEKLFSLNKHQLEEFCGRLEGQRLDSQITVQRNISGYKTARSSELRSILAEQRKKIDSSDDKAAASVTEDVTADFSFLQEYDKSGYQTSEGESGEDGPAASPAARNSESGNTLRDQIKKERKKMTSQANVAAGR